MKNIIVLFKTHLDVGFTDFSRNVIDQYNRRFIPRAIRVARELAQRGCQEGFTWTTGSYLIWQYLQQADPREKAELEEALRNKWIRWHGLPMTSHTEVEDAGLFRYGLSLSRKLDAAYGVKTVAAKMTDVPGHTKAMVPLLAEAGIELLHLGVNPASTPPDVPLLFRWQCGGKEVTVMYDKGDYGTFKTVPGTDTGVYFAHTGDNQGPSSPEDVLAIYEKLHAQYPEAVITAGDLNDVAEVIRPLVPYLPVITAELGDTWIHGAGTDPKKLSMYRGLLRLAENAPAEVQEAIYEKILLIPEHTWGMTLQKFLLDYANYSREHFEAVRHQENFQTLERSWEEQREYVYQAVENLAGSPWQEKARAAISEYRREMPDFSNMTAVSGNITLAGWEIAWDGTGAIVSLQKDGKIYADGDHPLAAFQYEAFTENQVNAFQARYLQPHMRTVWWAVTDFGKLGLARDMEFYHNVGATLAGAYTDGKALHLKLTGDAFAYEKYGCPRDMVLSLIPGEDGLTFDFAWFDKPACRIPEALWLRFCPTAPVTAIRKLGLDIHPQEVICNGNREMHATDGLLRFRDITLETLDTPLAAVGQPSVYRFENQYPDTDRGVYMNLFNNMWGTNFPMWNEGDARFRFVLR